MFRSKLSLNNYNYDINKDLIANHPKDGRKNSNLLIYKKILDKILDREGFNL